jgi:hypothetical protein
MIPLVYRYFVELYYGVIVFDSRTKNDIGLYALVCPTSEEIFEETNMLNFLQRRL